MVYSEFADEELVALVQAGQEDAMEYLLEKYKGLVKKKARAMFLIGGDTDDLIQEGMIGLYKAIRDYQGQKETAFYTFANLCVERQIYSAINASNRKKHFPLNTYVSFSSEEYQEKDTLEFNSGSMNEKLTNPEKIFIDQENVETMKQSIKQELSALEYQVFAMYIEGENYRDIATKLEKTPKSIDNAIQRIKMKVNQIVT